jgi:hypothetical protein
MTTTQAPQCTAITQQQGYQGWSNRETMIVNLWFSNDEYADGEVHRIATSGFDLYGQEQAYKQLAEEMVYGVMGEHDVALTQGLTGDLLGGALAEVNWIEIAKAHPARDYE